MQHSIVEYLSEHEGYRCGYCGSPDSNFSHGMWAHNLTCQDYLDLIDRGWRRSGKYVYKPTMDKMCCPLYTIRCHAPSLKLKKSQKKVLKKASRYFTTGEKPGSGGGVHQEDGGEEASGGVHPMPPVPQRLPQMPMDEVVEVQDRVNIQGSESKAEGVKGQSEVRVPSQHGEVMGEGAGITEDGQPNVSTEKQKKVPKPGLGADPTKPPCKKSKLRRLEKRQERLKQRTSSEPGPGPGPGPSTSASKADNSPKSLEEFIVDAIPGQEPKHRLEIKLVRSNPMSNEFRRTLKESHRVYQKYQMSIHNDTETKCNFGQYKRFLVDSPLVEQYSNDGPECGYGSFHQHYVLDGKIIAVGVIDILPTCVSSVYFYYDPEYRFLTLGTYSALRELAFTRLLHVTAPALEYYYMGFYVHSCRKMRYKGQYYPSYLLCPEAYTFHPIEECIPKLDINKYSRFAPPDAADTPVDLDEVLVLHKHLAMTYHDYRQYRPQATDDEDVREYAQMAGKKCAERMLLYRN